MAVDFNNTEIALAIESAAFDTEALINDLKTNLPSYMIPSKMLFFVLTKSVNFDKDLSNSD